MKQASAAFPENTLASFERAIRDGSEGVESGNMKATGRLLKTEEFNDAQDQDATGGGWVNGLKTSY